MGTDDLFKKRRKERRQRRSEFKNPKANSFLIITEGERTEPLYFKGLQKLIEEQVGGRVDVVEIPMIDIRGQGCSTGKLIEKTEQIVKEARVIYQNIWVVFDKDDFDDFDEAIRIGESKGYSIAWSNQSFEYWLYLHFAYSDTALHRDDWNEKLNEIFQEYQLGDGVYRKNYENIFELVDSFGGSDTAIKHVKRRMAQYKRDEQKPSEFEPGTTVYELVEKLKSYLINE